jgi:DNA modification methylase
MRYTYFDNIAVNPEWSFTNVRSTEQWTHGYHRYPAKFLPNVVKKLIETYAINNGKIADVFAGCGTTLVEAKAHGINSVGIDINPVAQLITKAKIKPVSPNVLNSQYEKIVASFSQYDANRYENIKIHDRIDYWFRQKEKKEIAFLYKEILSNKKENIKIFFLVCLSHILKNCSRWLMSGTKPQIDPNKIPAEPFKTFQLHCKKMMIKNALFYTELKKKKYLGVPCDIRLADARKTRIKANSIGTIITSPPYVTSYEYADIHQLTAYWYEYINDLPEFRKNFIGTFYSLSQDTTCQSEKAQQIVNELLEKDDRTAKEVANYFNDLSVVGKEMYRIVKKNGHICVVIGNTTVKDVKINSAEVFYEILGKVGFKEENVIKRSIPNKLMPTIRDKNTGRFSKKDNKNSKMVYPEEYILVFKK